MLRRPLPLTIAVPILAAIVGLGILSEDRAAAAISEAPKRTTNQMACASCHGGQGGTYRRMAEKRDDPAYEAWVRKAHATGNPKH